MGHMPTQLVTSDAERALLLKVCELLHVNPRLIPDDSFRIVYRTHQPVSDVAWREWLVDPSHYRRASGVPADLPPTRPRKEPIESTVLTRMLEERGLDPKMLARVTVTAELP